MDYKKFIEYIGIVARAHQEKVLPEAKAIRKHFRTGEENLYFTHSLWCAMMFLLETDLPADIRNNGALALLFHDVLEDTSEKLPKDLSEEVKYLVDEMTYEGGFDEEKNIVLEKPPIVQLLKLYDKTATLYDGALKMQRHKPWAEFTQKLANNVEKEYGELNIVLLARELVKKYQ